MSRIIASRNEKPTWTEAELNPMTKKELDILAFGGVSFVKTPAVKALVAVKPFSPANSRFAQDFIKNKAQNPSIAPARIESQVVPTGGEVVFGPTHVKVTNSNGQVQVANATPVPTFNAKKKSSMDFLIVAIVGTTEVHQGKVRQLHTIQQWQSWFGGHSSVINSTGLNSWVELVTEAVTTDAAFKTLHGDLGKTVAGFQYVNYVHDLLLRLVPDTYMSLLWSFAYDLCSAFVIDRTKVDDYEGTSLWKVSPRMVVKTNGQGVKESVPLFPLTSWKRIPVDRADVKEYCQQVSTPLYYYVGGAQMSFVTQKADGTLKSALAIATSMMQFRGGNESGLASFTSSLGFGNLLAPATRRQSFIINQAKIIMEDKQIPILHLTPGDFFSVCNSLPMAKKVTDQQGELVTADTDRDGNVIAQYVSSYLVVMSHEDQTKLSIMPEEFRRIPIVTATAYPGIHVWWENPDVKQSEQERANSAAVFSKKCRQAKRFVCWTAVYSEAQFFDPDNVRIYALDGRGAFDFGAIVTNCVHKVYSSAMLLIDHEELRTFVPSNLAKFFLYVARSNTKVSSFLLAPFYSYTPYSNAVKRLPAKSTMKIEVLEDGSWKPYSMASEIYFGDDPEELEEVELEKPKPRAKKRVKIPVASNAATTVTTVTMIVPEEKEERLQKKKKVKKIEESQSADDSESDAEVAAEDDDEEDDDSQDEKKTLEEGYEVAGVEEFTM